jgi:hypothetical protein
MKLKVYKIGDKFGFSFPKEVSKNLGFSKGQVLNLMIFKDNKEKEFITKFNSIIAIKKEASDYLDLKESEFLEVKLSKLEIIEKSKNLFKKGKIDLLCLIQKIKVDREFVCNSFKRGEEEFLRVWSYHSRGSCKEVILKRFIDADIFGRFLGQLQAEGTKEFRFRLEFVNKSIQEHEDYVRYLSFVGIPKEELSAGLITHPDLFNSINLSEFESKLGLKIINISQSNKSRRGYGYRIYIGSTILSEIILGSMDYLRKLLVKSEWDTNLTILASGFLAKLFNGDGSLEVITKNRITPEARIKIVDRNLSYLDDYKTILEKFGFKPQIDKKYIYVRSYANLENLLTLYRIKAFYQTDKWKKLTDVIKAKLSLAKNSSLKLTSLNEHYPDELSDFSKQD